MIHSIRSDNEKNKNLFFYSSLWFLQELPFKSFLSYSVCKPKAQINSSEIVQPSGEDKAFNVETEERQKDEDCCLKLFC